MGAMLAGILAMTIILLVVGLGWHVVWDGITKGARTVKDTIFQVVNYYLTPNHDSTDHSAVHGNGLNKA